MVVDRRERVAEKMGAGEKMGRWPALITRNATGEQKLTARLRAEAPRVNFHQVLTWYFLCSIIEVCTGRHIVAAQEHHLFSDVVAAISIVATTSNQQSRNSAG